MLLGVVVNGDIKNELNSLWLNLKEVKSDFLELTSKVKQFCQKLCNFQKMARKSWCFVKQFIKKSRRTDTSLQQLKSFISYKKITCCFWMELNQKTFHFFFFKKLTTIIALLWGVRNKKKQHTMNDDDDDDDGEKTSCLKKEKI